MQTNPQNQSGFTLIEMLIVVMIIALLAAIAIPVYLNQRKKGWGAAAESALQSAVRAQHSFAATNNGLYTTDQADLEGEGYNPAADVSIISRTTADGTRFCIQARHARDVQTFEWKLSTFESDVGKARSEVDDCNPSLYTEGPANQAP